LDTGIFPLLVATIVVKFANNCGTIGVIAAGASDFLKARVEAFPGGTKKNYS
jgi:hypothetical protein